VWVVDSGAPKEPHGSKASPGKGRFGSTPPPNDAVFRQKSFTTCLAFVIQIFLLIVIVLVNVPSVL